MGDVPRRLSMGGEFALATLPTLTVLLTLVLTERFGGQRVLFAPLASSAFLIYLDPGHRANSVRTLILAQGAGVLAGLAARGVLGEGYVAAGTAMVATIAAMILLDAIHPPAVSTALGFGFRTGPESQPMLFAGALTLVAVLVGLQRASVHLLARLGSRPDRGVTTEDR